MHVGASFIVNTCSCWIILPRMLRTDSHGNIPPLLFALERWDVLMHNLAPVIISVMFVCGVKWCSSTQLLCVCVCVSSFRLQFAVLIVQVYVFDHKYCFSQAGQDVGWGTGLINSPFENPEEQRDQEREGGRIRENKKDCMLQCGVLKCLSHFTSYLISLFLYLKLHVEWSVSSATPALICVCMCVWERETVGEWRCCCMTSQICFAVFFRGFLWDTLLELVLHPTQLLAEHWVLPSVLESVEDIRFLKDAWTLFLDLFWVFLPLFVQ